MHVRSVFFLDLFVEIHFHQRLIWNILFVCECLQFGNQRLRQTDRNSSGRWFEVREGRIFSALLQSIYSVESCVAQNSRSSSSLLNSGIGLSLLRIELSFLFALISSRNNTYCVISYNTFFYFVNCFIDKLEGLCHANGQQSA